MQSTPDPLKCSRKRGLRLVSFALIAKHPSLGLTRSNYMYLCPDYCKENKVVYGDSVNDIQVTPVLCKQIAQGRNGYWFFNWSLQSSGSFPLI